MSLLVRSLALIELLGMGRARAAWTDVVGVGVVRRPILRKIAMFSQGLSHLRLDPVAAPHTHTTPIALALAPRSRRTPRPPTATPFLSCFCIIYDLGNLKYRRLVPIYGHAVRAHSILRPQSAENTWTLCLRKLGSRFTEWPLIACTTETRDHCASVMLRPW
jgi:hypothetical protein